MFEEFIGLQPLQVSQKFDIDSLGEYLKSQLGSTEVLHTIEQFKGGQSNPTFRLKVGDSYYVMRSRPGPKAKLLPSAHAIEREYRVQAALGKTGFPVARMVLLCEDESIIGRGFYLMEVVEGRVLWDQSLPHCGVDERQAIYRQMNEVLALLHTLDYTALGLGDYGKSGNYFARQIERWSKQYRLSETESIPAMDNLMAWLPQHIPATEGATLVHGDYRLDNMIFDSHVPRIKAIIDWELSTLGNPLADFSYHCMSWHIAPGQFRGIAGLDFASLGIPSEAEYIRWYEKRTGTTVPTQDWAFYMAYNLFRMAAILQGIMKRYVDGTAASQQAKEAGERTAPMANLGWQWVSKHWQT